MSAMYGRLDQRLKHKDAFGRVEPINKQDEAFEHYLRPKDGRLTRLAVQASSYSIYRSRQKRSWTSIAEPKVHVPTIIQLVCWMYSFIYEEGSGQRIDGGGESLFFLWIPCCLILVILLIIPANLEGQMRNNGYYDPILYRDWGRSKVARNRYENPEQADESKASPGSSTHEDTPVDVEAAAISRPIPTSVVRPKDASDDGDDILPRHFGPRFLCFLKDKNDKKNLEFETRTVASWVQEHGDHADTDFVFVSYTRHQFCVDLENEIYKPNRWTKKYSDDEKADLVQIALKDRQTLLEYGARAAHDVGKQAFWLDFECIRDMDNKAKAVSQSDDVNRICDIVRAAHSMIVLVGPSVDNKVYKREPQGYDPNTTIKSLQEYGDRLWTLPELLLCSPEHRIKLYFHGKPGPPEVIAKRNFPARAVWRDADNVRQLVDHYESTIHLSPLELVSIALKCLTERETQKFSEGDIAYALMGLLRRRPRVVRTDSSFEAFARLSLANVNDSLLERLLCMQPVRRDAPWNKIEDAWDVHLWDIEPRCQVAGIVDDQTISLDGAFGATIQWDRMDQVAFFKRPTLMRTLAKIVLRTVPANLLVGILLTITGSVYIKPLLASSGTNDDTTDNITPSGDNTTTSTVSTSGINVLFYILFAGGILFLLMATAAVFAAPSMIFNLYRGKFWSTQAMFIGLEGVPSDLGQIEHWLFGLNHGRLKWSAAGSTFLHDLPVDGECKMLLSPENKSSVDAEFVNEDGRLFTLIDTYTLTATVFRAQRPPSALIVCGQEGGMQRAVLCSYDWKRATFAREAVVRIKTLALNRMSRVDRFRFALSRRADEPQTPESKEK